MPNYLSTVGALADEVAVLLRVDNLDRRIFTWIATTFNDINRRNPSSLFYTSTVETITTAETATLSSAVNGLPVAAIYRMADSFIYMPRQVTMIDYNRLARATQGGSQASGPVPLAWAIGPDFGSDGRTALYTYPVPSQAGTATILWAGKNKTGVPLTGDYLDLPYHFEHAVIWVACAVGAKVTRNPAWKIFRDEYESAVANLYHIMTYTPDTVPVRRSVTGPYAGMPQLSPRPAAPAEGTIGS